MNKGKIFHRANMKTVRFNNLSHLMTSVLMSVIFLSSCTSSQPTQSGSYRQLYDYDSQSLHPEYVLYHFSDDSSQVHFKIKSGSLLYTREGSGSPFEAKVKLQVIAFDEKNSASDTTEIILKDREQKTDNFLLSNIKFPLIAGKYNLVVNLTDVNRNTTQTHFIRTNKADKINGQNFLLLDGDRKEPCFGGFVDRGTKIEILSDRNKNIMEQLTVQKLAGEIKLPPPPFSTNQPELPSFINSISTLTNYDKNEGNSFIAEDGVYLVTLDPEKKTGLVFSTSSVFFPSIESTEQLPWPLRYITTKAEYDEIVKSNYSKSLIDNFWLECAGNKERARDLIRIYYSRVEEANIFFSNYTEGWRTDRGMIHIVFGNPTKIIKQEQSETWIYG